MRVSGFFLFSTAAAAAGPNLRIFQRYLDDTIGNFIWDPGGRFLWQRFWLLHLFFYFRQPLFAVLEAFAVQDALDG